MTKSTCTAGTGCKCGYKASAGNGRLTVCTWGKLTEKGCPYSKDGKQVIEELKQELEVD